jgi:hypothetical protein
VNVLAVCALGSGCVDHAPLVSVAVTKHGPHGPPGLWKSQLTKFPFESNTALYRPEVTGLPLLQFVVVPSTVVQFQVAPCPSAGSMILIDIAPIISADMASEQQTSKMRRNILMRRSFMELNGNGIANLNIRRLYLPPPPEIASARRI